MTSDPFDRGHVIWHDGLFNADGRPWLVVSDDRHPFHGEEYLVVGVTTTERENAVQLTGEEWKIGGLPRTSYVSPWFLTTLKHADVSQGVGMIAETTVETVLRAVRRYL